MPEGLDGLVQLSGHRRDNQRGIDYAGEEGAERHVRPEAGGDRFVNRVQRYDPRNPALPVTSILYTESVISLFPLLLALVLLRD